MSDNNVSYKLQQIQSTQQALTDRLAAATSTHAELLAIPNAPSVIVAIQTMAYTKAVEQGL